MSHLRYVLTAIRPYRRSIAVAVVAWLGIMLVDLGTPLTVAVLIDVIVAQGRYDLLTPLMLAFACLPLLAAVMNFTSNYIMTAVSQRLVLDIRLDLYRKVHGLSCRYLQDTTTGRIMERLRGDVAQLQALLTNQTPAILVQVVTGLVMVGVMAFISLPLTAMVLAAIALYAVNYKWFVRQIQAVQRRYRRRIDSLSGSAQERLTGNVVVKAFGGERQESRRFLRGNFVAERTQHRFRLLNLAYGTTSSIIAWGTYLMVIVVGTYLAIHDVMTYGAVTAMAAFTMRLTTPAVQLAELSNQIQQAKVSLDRIFELMNAEPDATSSTGRVLPAILGRVSLRGVRFAYEESKPVLRGLDLHVEPGQTVALVGHTGCGKSTVASLLYRYFDVQGGSIEVDGVDVRELDPRWYRRHLAMVPQDPIVFDTTLAENIAYGRPDATPEQIERAARQAELGRLIDSLPQGVNTRLGEDGVSLSVGEKQRLCIARAILAEPRILILDEATSSLDPASEAMIQLALKRAMAKRTCFVIAHRLSTIVDADLIVILEAGRVLEQGNHRQLMAKPQGHYRHLVLTQMGQAPRKEIA